MKTSVRFWLVATLTVFVTMSAGNGLPFRANNQTKTYEGPNLTVLVESGAIKIKNKTPSNLTLNIAQGRSQDKIRVASNSVVSLSSDLLSDEDLVITSTSPSSDEQIENSKYPELFSEISDLDPSLVQHSTVMVIPASMEPNQLEDVAFAAGISSTRIRYQTFIPEDFVYGFPPCASGLYTYFSGDDRSWNPDSNAYKTRFDMTINWLDNGSLAPTRSVRSSKLYILSGGTFYYQETKTASTSSMKYAVLAHSSDQTEFEFWQNVVNPFCPSFLNSGITFSYKVKVLKSGAYWMEGDSVAVPNHEVYIKDSDMSIWKPIFQRKHVDYTCLAGYVVDPTYCINFSDYSGYR
jgi:hypothetical protein